MEKYNVTIDDLDSQLFDIKNDIFDFKDKNERQIEDILEIMMRIDNNLRDIKSTMILLFTTFIAFALFCIGEIGGLFPL